MFCHLSSSLESSLVERGLQGACGRWAEARILRQTVMTLNGLDGGRAEQAVHSAAESALHGADQITAACPVANHARIDGRTPVGALVRHLLAADDAIHRSTHHLLPTAHRGQAHCHPLR